MRKIKNRKIISFEKYLIDEEKSNATIEKYIRDINAFVIWLNKETIEKGDVFKYKEKLINEYAPRSVNSILSSLNSFFTYLEWHELKVKSIKLQRLIFADKDKELTKAEYERLLYAAKNKGNEKLYFLMQTICSTGIRVSELRFITMEAIKCGQALIKCKGKVRIIILPQQLCSILKKYAKKEKIYTGIVFITKTGRPLDRSNIWKLLKALCESANVPKDKVFPHNFRHLFARTYYSVQKDIVRLADILGHSSIETTRIYTMESGNIHRLQVQKLGMLFCKKYNTT